MSCTAVLSPVPIPDPFAVPRKRTSSFSAPKPTKAARNSLKRTSSFLSLPVLLEQQHTPSTDAPGPSRGRASHSSPNSNFTALVPHNRSLRHYKEQRQRRHLSPAPAASVQNAPHTPTTSSPRCTSAPLRLRTTSPLAPSPSLRPPRPKFPRTKRDADADLHRRAVLAHMRCSPEGQKILLMGAKLAVSMLTATRELERIVASQTPPDDDVTMADPECLLEPQGRAEHEQQVHRHEDAAWVVVPGAPEWEMVECGA